MTRWRAHLFPWLSLAYLAVIYGLPTAITLDLVKLFGASHIWVIVVSPILWTLLFLALAGTFSLPHQFAIVPGKMRRDVSKRMYFHRRLYGLCWTTVFYNKPVYFLCLSIPFLKWIVFRLFGYRGSMNFTVYPDTWIRDLPLLHFEDGVYVSNRATLGTNMVLSNGFLLVDEITLRANALVGHLVMLAPGVILEAGAEVGVGSGIGIRTTLESGAFVGVCCVIEHGVRISKDAEVSAHSYVGSRSYLGVGTKLPPGAMVPPRTRVEGCKQVMTLERVRAEASEGAGKIAGFCAVPVVPPVYWDQHVR
jgi:carbonic anhydrase/acetyltransferase-like protein (isoleucine patch superfamily)